MQLAKNLLPSLSAPAPRLKFKRQDITNMAMMMNNNDLEEQKSLKQSLRISTPKYNERKR